MSKAQKRLAAMQNSRTNVRFDDLVALLLSVGFVADRTNGSHQIFRHATRTDITPLNVQQGKSGEAKPYQVQQVLDCIETHGLEIE